MTVTPRRRNKRTKRGGESKRAIKYSASAPAQSAPSFRPPFQQATALAPYFDLANSTLGGLTPAIQEAARSSSVKSLRVLARENPKGCEAFAQLCHGIFLSINQTPEWQRHRVLQKLGPITGQVIDFRQFDWGTTPVLILKYTSEGRVEARIDDQVRQLVEALDGLEFDRVRQCPAHRVGGSVCRKFFYARRRKTIACSPICQATTRQARRRAEL